MTQTNKLFILPEYMRGQDKETIHHWKMWAATAYKIDNHPERVYTAVHPKTGVVKDFDCKAPIGVIAKNARDWGASEADLKAMDEIARKLQVLKNEKGKYNTWWSRKVYGKVRGDKSLLSIHSPEIIDMFGRFFTAEEIRKITQEKWGFIVKTSEIIEFYNLHKDKIERLKAEYVIAGKETRLSTDAGRMEVLSKIAWEMEQKFDKTKSIEVSKELRAVVEQIRKEVKGEEIKLTVDGRIDITATIQANQTIHEALHKLPINMIVIGLTAAKQGIDPAYLISSLANSYYSKFNGFNKLNDKQEVQLPGQYIRMYNWEEIKANNERHIEDIPTIEVVEEKIEPVKKAIILDKKQQMLELLKGLKNDEENI